MPLLKISGEQFTPDLLNVMQEAETTKEDDLKKVKEEVGKCPECGAPCKLIDRTYQEEIHDVHYTEHVYQPPAEAARGEISQPAIYKWAHEAKQLLCLFSDALPGGDDWEITIDKLVDGFPKFISAATPESGEIDDWISVDDQLPTESGRYWCYIQELTDLGFSYFQWNCAYNANERRFSDSTLTNGENVTHWRKLPDPPKRKEVPNG
jgi:hypothetical protein